MVTTLTTPNSAAAAPNLQAARVWISRAMEACWLLAVFLVPLAFVQRDHIVGEAVIAYVEIPKIAALRFLASALALLWLLEWALAGRLPFARQPASPGGEAPAPKRGGVMAALKEQPGRWLLAAAGFYVAATLISGLLSPSFSVSFWGEIPGQDSFAVYTMLSYVVLFAAIAAHVKTRAQVWRLVGALAAMATIAGFVAILQDYGFDIFDLLEPAGANRATSTMGNAIFFAAVLCMTIPLTLATAVIHLREIENGGVFWQRLLLWAVPLLVQMLGITFSLSRGPWVATLVGLAGFTGLTLLFLGLRPYRRLVSIVALLALCAGLTVLVVFGPSALPAGGGNGSAGAGGGSGGGAASGSAVAQRFESIGEQGASAEFGPRRGFWLGSLELAQAHPWFAGFPPLNLAALRPLIGYGPDFFRYTYLLKSPAGTANQLPFEPDHAHNLYLHQLVELGYLGFLATLGVLGVMLLTAAYQIFWCRRGFTEPHQLLLFALAAIVAGRSLELVVGVSRVSDWTVFWALLGLYVALPNAFAAGSQNVAAAPTATVRRAQTTRNRGQQGTGGGDKALVWRAMLVAPLIIGVVWLMAAKTLNYPIAALTAAAGVQEFQRGNANGTLEALRQASALAPDVPTYYNHQAIIYDYLRRNPERAKEPECDRRRQQIEYAVCLSEKGYQTNLKGIAVRPYYFRAQLAAAESAAQLGFLIDSDALLDEAFGHFQDTIALVPSSWPIRARYAAALIEAGRYEQALPIVEEALVITGATANAARPLVLQGIAYRQLQRPEEAIASFEQSLKLEDEGQTALQSHQFLADLYAKQGKPDLARSHFDKYQAMRQASSAPN